MSALRLPAAAGLLLLCSAAVANEPPPSIPAYHGETFAGAAVDFPAALSGKTTILILGFSQSSREDVAGWGRHLTLDFAEKNTVAFYEMPVIASVPRFLRGFVSRKIKEAVPAKAQPHLLLVVDHEDEWKHAAAFKKTADTYVLLVDALGKVRWETAGPWTTQAYAALRHEIQQQPHP